MRYILLTILSLSLLTACTTATTTPIPTQPPPTRTPTPTSLPAPTHAPTPTPEWGIAFAVLHPEAVEMPSPNRPMRLHLIRSDGNGLMPLSGEMEHVTDLTASPDGQYLLFIAIREDTCPDWGVDYFDHSHLYALNVQSGEILTLTSGATTTEWLAAWSPDGQQIAFVSSEVNAPCSPSPPCYEEGCTPMVTEYHTHLYVMNRDGTDKRRLTSQEGDISAIAWSPTGEQILFTQHGALWIVNPDGSGLLKVANALTDYLRLPYATQPAWSPDGRRIAFVAPGIGPEHRPDVFIINADGSNLFNLTNHPSNDYQPAWSPDGRHIAFVTTRLGYQNIYTIGVDGNNVTQIFHSPTEGAYHPTWSPDGSRIAFVVGMSAMWKEQLFLADLTSGFSYQLSQEFVGDRPAWALIPSR